MSENSNRGDEEARLDIQEDNYETEDLDKMKARLAAIEEESARLAKMENEHEQSTNPNYSGPHGGRERREDVDARSVFVGNVDYGASPEEIQDHFKSCGSINRVTILLDKHTGHPKGYAYVEFADPSLVNNALVLNDSEFRGRQLKVTLKRTNLPGMHRGRGRGGPMSGFGGRGGFRGGRGGPFGGNYGPPRGIGGGYRGGGRGRGRGDFRHTPYQ
ncbi:uncharacterized protein PV09_09064 [Verruconis gallopava]|uniref:RRM domain-containing protein n=1 Tax=Verruconis gallopava TaxID=253628 RepID=A0A0D1ZXV5_9PEZI|nr:uncharacterized protein PV09_09064 [Verruconis gallopava]KIV99297.1 hypothetical protein PV09_09064 [Verruconis gallopava]